MNITIAGIINARSAIEKLTAQNLPARKAFNIAKLLKRLSEEYDLFEKNQNRTGQEIRHDQRRRQLDCRHARPQVYGRDTKPHHNRDRNL